MVDFYAVLVASQATVFGIFLSGVLVYSQIVGSRFSYSVNSAILSSRGASLFYLYSIPSLVLSLVALVFAVYSDEAWSGDLFGSLAYLAVTAELLAASVLCLPLVVWALGDFLDPTFVLGIIRSRVSESGVIDSARERGDLRAPSPPPGTFVISGVEVGDGHTSEEYERKRSQYDAILEDLNDKRSAGHLRDPILPIVDVTTAAISNHDESTARQGLKCFEDVATDMLADGVIPDASPGHYDPHDQRLVASLMADHLAFLHETARVVGHHSLSGAIVKTWAVVLETIVSDTLSGPSASVWLDLGRRFAVDALNNRSANEFHEVNLGIAELGKRAIEAKDVTLSDATCIVSFLLGEAVADLPPGFRSLTGRSLSDTPGEIDSIVQCLDGLTTSMARSDLSVTPVILFDALYVVSMALIDIAAGGQNAAKEPLTSLRGQTLRLGDACVKSHDEPMVGKAFSDLIKLFNACIQRGLLKQADQFAEDIVDLGYRCGYYNPPVDGVSKIIDMAVAEVKLIADYVDVRPLVREQRIRGRPYYGDPSGSEEFVRRLSDTLGLSFDFGDST